MPSYPAAAAISNAAAVVSGKDAAVDKPTGMGGRGPILTTSTLPAASPSAAQKMSDRTLRGLRRPGASNAGRQDARRGFQVRRMQGRGGRRYRVCIADDENAAGGVPGS